MSRLTTGTLLRSVPAELVAGPPGWRDCAPSGCRLHDAAQRAALPLRDGNRPERTTARGWHPHRPRRQDHLRRLSAPGPPAGCAAAAERPGPPRRDAVHRPAPGLGAVAEADHPRAGRGHRLPAPRPDLAVPEGDRALQAGVAPADRAVVGAGD